MKKHVTFFERPQITTWRKKFADQQQTLNDNNNNRGRSDEPKVTVNTEYSFFQTKKLTTLKEDANTDNAKTNKIVKKHD